MLVTNQRDAWIIPQRYVSRKACGVLSCSLFLHTGQLHAKKIGRYAKGFLFTLKQYRFIWFTWLAQR